MENHVLIKFISKTEYVNDFLNGSLYMNSLYYFWNEYPILEAKRKKEALISAHPELNPDDILVKTDNKLTSEQADIFEGTIGFDNSGFPEALKEYMLTDAIITAEGFKYCNTLCFYRLDYRYNAPLLGYSIPTMSGFGEYVVIIKDKPEFLRRIGKAVEREGYYYLCGDVQYMAIKGEESTVRDCFVKMDKYKNQNEWRIALYRGVKDTNAFRLEIGDIRDIAESVLSKDLIRRLDELVLHKDIKPSVVVGRKGCTSVGLSGR